jgi:hypothetical protein
MSGNAYTNRLAIIHLETQTSFQTSGKQLSIFRFNERRTSISNDKASVVETFNVPSLGEYLRAGMEQLFTCHCWWCHSLRVLLPSVSTGHVNNSQLAHSNQSVSVFSYKKYVGYATMYRADWALAIRPVAFICRYWQTGLWWQPVWPPTCGLVSPKKTSAHTSFKYHPWSKELSKVANNISLLCLPALKQTLFLFLKIRI